MSIESCVAIAGMIFGLALMLVGRSPKSHKEFRLVGGFLLVAGYCYLLGLQLPGLW